MTTNIEEQLNHDVSLQRLCEGRGIALKGRGPVLTAACPFHSRTSPTLTITTTTNTWACPSCRVKAGSVIEFTMKAEGISKRHAVEVLRGDHGGGGATPGKVVKGSSVKKLPDVITQDGDDATLLSQVMGFYSDSLKRDEKAMAFLQDSKISSSEVMEKFQIGFSDRSLGYRIPKANRKAGADIRSRLQRLGILKDTGHEALRGCITVPLRDGNGVILGTYGRRLQLDTRKAESPDVFVGKGLFNLEAFTASKDIIVTSTPFESLILWSCGIRNVTSLMGLDDDGKMLVEAITKNGVTKVTLVFPRKEGDNTITKLAQKMANVKVQLFKASLPAGMDVVSFSAAAGDSTERMMEVIRAAEWSGGVRPTVKTEPDPSTIVMERSSDVPAASSEKTTPAGEITIELGDRRWRIRGLSKNTSYETMRVNVHVSRDTKDPRTSGFHVDNVELYASRQRHVFVEQAGEELGIAPEILKRDLGHVLLRLEALQDEQIKATLAPKETVPTMTDMERDAALALLRDPHLLDRVGADFERAGVVGEKNNLVIGYLAAVSRKLNDPLAVLVQSSSAAGKSSLLDAVLSFIPNEDRVEFSAMTGQSLYYMEPGALRHKVLAISEETGAAKASYALKLLQSAGSLTIASTAKEAGTGRLTTHSYEVQGPVSLMMTTTATQIDEELLNRCIVLSVDEGAEQTRAIHVRQREAETLQGHLARETRERILALHQNAQRLLLPVLVVNPFAPELTFSDASTRARRDHRKLLTLIRAVTLLHQHQRTKKVVEHEGHAVEYIEVTKADIETATRLAEGILGPSLDDLPPHTRNVLDMLDKMVTEACTAGDLERQDFRFSRREAREKSGMGGTQLWVHIKRLVQAEFLLVHPARHGRGVVYELAFVNGRQETRKSDQPGKSTGTTMSVRGSKPTVRASFGGDSGHVRGTQRGTSEPNPTGEAPQRSGSPETNHRGSPSKRRRTSSTANGAGS